MAECYNIHILDLPDELLFHIFSCLGEEDQIVVSHVCQRWYSVVNYEPHWKKLLLQEVGIHNVSKVTSCSELAEYNISKDPSQIKAAVWDPSVVTKTIFTMCSPRILAKKRQLKIQQKIQQESSLISKVKTYLWDNSKDVVPKWLMFGPGLETPGISIIARKILTGRSSLFHVVRMLNGGISAVKYKGNLIHLTFLYSNTKALRRPLPAKERLGASKLFAKVSDQWIPTDPAKMACHGSSCIVFVIDATLEIEDCDDPFPDLTLIVKQTYLQYRNKELIEGSLTEQPLCLVVLACIPDENSPKPDWYRLLYGLNLWKYYIPWQVCLVTASNMGNISIAFDWAVSRICYSRKF